MYSNWDLAPISPLRRVGHAHSKNAVIQVLQGVSCVEFACSSHACNHFLWVFCLPPPQSKIMFYREDGLK